MSTISDDIAAALIAAKLKAEAELKRQNDLINRLRNLSNYKEEDKLDPLLMLVLFPNANKGTTITNLIKEASTDKLTELEGELDAARAAVPEYEIVLVPNN